MAARGSTDLERLRLAVEALRHTAAVHAPEGRLVHSGSPTSAETAVLLEIDQTILRRALRFLNDQGQSLRLETAERRVFRRLADAASAGTSPGRTTSADETAILTQSIRRFCEKATKIWVTTSIIPHDQQASNVGTSLADLEASLASLDRTRVDAAPDIEDFLAAIAAYLPAYLQVVGQQPPKPFGDPEIGKQLAAIHDAAAPEIGGGEGATQFRQWCGADDADWSVALVERGSLKLWLAVPHARVGDCLIASRLLDIVPEVPHDRTASAS